MPPDAVVIVSDAHLGYAPEPVAAAFHRFLGIVPQLGRHLVINGDLFDFWFEYRRVIPRDAFPTLAALHQLRQAGVALTLTGGNHDRWSRDFWSKELGAEFSAGPLETRLAGFRTFLAHGDTLAETRLASRLFHFVTRLPITAQVFRWVHPDLGFWVVDRLSGALAATRDPQALDRAAGVQERFALDLLGRRPDLDLVVLGHSHRPALREVGGRRWYLNPGAWMEGLCYALLNAGGPQLRQFA